MTRFETDKTARIKRLPALRVTNALGMIGWRANQYDDAEPKFRLLHPVNWVLVPAMILLAILLHGVPEAVRQVFSFFKRDAVWW